MTASQWDCSIRISSTYYWRTRQFLKAEEFQRNSVILSGKYNNKYSLHTIQNWRATCKTLSLSLCVWGEKSRATAGCVPHTRAYGASHTGALRIHSDYIYIYIYAFSRRFYPKRLTIAFRLYIFISTCVPWESNPQPFAQLMQCSTTEPHRNTWTHELINNDYYLIQMNWIIAQITWRRVKPWCGQSWWKYICAKLIHSLQLTHWRVISEHLLASG